MGIRAQRICIWGGPISLLMAFAGLYVAGFLPPPSPAASAEQIAAIYREHSLAIRIGAILFMAAICSALAAGEGGGRKPATYRPATAINKLIGPPQMQTLCARISICDPPYAGNFGWILVGTN